MLKDVFDLVIIGGGAAGLMAAGEAARLGLSVVVLEGQKEPGQKVLIAGGGRCNVTNQQVREQDYSSGCSHTLRHVLAGFSSQQTVDFFKQWGVSLVLEGQKYFPSDGKARTVRDALFWSAQLAGARIICKMRVTSIVREVDHFNIIAGQALFSARCVLVTTGGLSYSGTGSDGSGYGLAKSFGHKIIPTRPALTPLVAQDNTFADLSGITVAVSLSLWVEGRKVETIGGPMLLTHRGFSGPAPMEMSGFWLKHRASSQCQVLVDFFPEMKGDNLSFLSAPGLHKRSIKNVLTHHFPERLVVVLLKEAQLDPLKVTGELAGKDKKVLATVFRSYPLKIKETMGYVKAEVTAGGVDLNELKGATLESRLQEGLYFAGEVVDVDGRIGGFNLQWAWASGMAAARAIARRIRKN